MLGEVVDFKLRGERPRFGWRLGLAVRLNHECVQTAAHAVERT